MSVLVPTAIKIAVVLVVAIMVTVLLVTLTPSASSLYDCHPYWPV